MLELLIIVIHQVIFQGMFVVKNVVLKKATGKQIRGKNVEATISISYFVIFIIFSLMISYFDISFGKLHILSDNASLLLALGILILNLVLSALSLVHLKDSWRVGVIENQKTDLITNGLYGFTRNPYFLAYFLMFIAYTVLLQSLVLLGLSIVGFILVHTMIVKEEKYLLSIHGDMYLSYKSKVPRYFII